MSKKLSHEDFDKRVRAKLYPNEEGNKGGKPEDILRRLQFMAARERMGQIKPQQMRVE